MVKIISGKSEKSLQEQLIDYAERVVHDRQSINVLEAFLNQMDSLFNKLHSILFKESNLAAGIVEGKSTINWSVISKEHDEVRMKLAKNLNDFVFFIKRVISLAKDDQKFLERNKSLIANMLSPDKRELFLKNADAGIKNEKQYLEVLSYLESLKKDSEVLIKKLDRVKEILERAVDKETISEKEISFIEETRFKSKELLEKIQKMEEYIPGLRDLDAESAKTLGMLADII